MPHKPLNIFITADPEIPVPPKLYGGIERIIDMLVKGFLDRGHHVSLFAHKDSITGAKLYPYQGKRSEDKLDTLQNIALINSAIKKEEVDIIHNFGRLAYLLPHLLKSLPKIMSYQRDPTTRQVKIANFLAKNNSLAFTGCSDYITKQFNLTNNVYTVYNGVPLSTYQLKEKVSEDAPLVFLGRLEPVKGVYEAVEVAQKTNRKLIIAGNIPPEFESFYKEKIAPVLNEQIKYIGPVNDTQKNELLGQAYAFLMPIQFNEPFGIVMAEAMACGTPVIGFNKGSIPEVIINGVNGFRCDTVEQMVENISHISTINRKEVRKDAELRFSSDVIVENYLSIYRELIDKSTTNLAK